MQIGTSSLQELICHDIVNIPHWILDRHELQKLPEHLANALLAKLLEAFPDLRPGLLDLFCESATEILFLKQSTVGSKNVKLTFSTLVSAFKFRNLERLGLSSVKTDLRHVPGLDISSRTSLTYLSFEGWTPKVADASWLHEKLAGLQFLDLRGQEPDTPLTMEPILMLTALTSLRLESFDLSSQDALCLPQLKTLHFLRALHLAQLSRRGTPESSTFPMQLTQLTLVYLDLDCKEFQLKPDFGPDLKVLEYGMGFRDYSPDLTNAFRKSVALERVSIPNFDTPFLHWPEESLGRNLGPHLQELQLSTYTYKRLTNLPAWEDHVTRLQNLTRLEGLGMPWHKLTLHGSPEHFFPSTLKVLKFCWVQHGRSSNALWPALRTLEGLEEFCCNFSLRERSPKYVNAVLVVVLQLQNLKVLRLRGSTWSRFNGSMRRQDKGQALQRLPRLCELCIDSGNLLLSCMRTWAQVGPKLERLRINFGLWLPRRPKATYSSISPDLALKYSLDRFRRLELSRFCNLQQLWLDIDLLKYSSVHRTVADLPRHLHTVQDIKLILLGPALWTHKEFASFAKSWRNLLQAAVDTLENWTKLSSLSLVTERRSDSSETEQEHREIWRYPEKKRPHGFLASPSSMPHLRPYNVIVQYSKMYLLSIRGQKSNIECESEPGLREALQSFPMICLSSHEQELFQ